MAATGNKKILIVEDGPDIRVMMDCILSDDYNVISCEDGRCGVSMATNEKPETASTPIIILTAGALKEGISEGYVPGADDCIFKPFDPDDLMERI